LIRPDFPIHFLWIFTSLLTPIGLLRWIFAWLAN